MKKRIIIRVIKSLILKYERKIVCTTVLKDNLKISTKEFVHSNYMTHNSSIKKIEKEYIKQLKKYKRCRNTLIEILDDIMKGE